LNSTNGATTVNIAMAVSAGHAARAGQRLRSMRINAASTSAARMQRMPARPNGPSAGLAMRISGNDAPHRADMAINCVK
jgi:hypothetical protein